jgi:hypothetical protein
VTGQVENHGARRQQEDQETVCSVGWWLVCSERRVLLAGCWFVLREKYCWLVADKPSDQGEN